MQASLPSISSRQSCPIHTQAITGDQDGLDGQTIREGSTITAGKQDTPLHRAVLMFMLHCVCWPLRTSLQHKHEEQYVHEKQRLHGCCRPYRKAINATAGCREAQGAAPDQYLMHPTFCDQEDESGHCTPRQAA